jgi:ferritin heavy chain
MCDFLEEEFLKEQIETIHEISTFISELKRAGPAGLGEYLWDKTTMKNKTD